VDGVTLVILKYLPSIKKKGVVMPSTEREEPNIVLSLGGGKESKKLL
jgi:hypothetical protein